MNQQLEKSSARSVGRPTVSIGTTVRTLAGLVFVFALNLGAQTAWLAPSSGGWSTATNWTAGVPAAGVNATIASTGAPFLVSQNAGTITATTLTLNSADATLALTGNALLNLSTSAGSTFAAGTLRLTGSRLVGNVTLENGFQVLNTSGSSQLRFSLNRGLIRSTNGTLTLSSRVAFTTFFTNEAGGQIITDGGNAFAGLGSSSGDGTAQEWKNSGELIATNGGRMTLGDCHVSNLGVIRVSDTARVEIGGTIVNTGSTLSGPLGGAYDAVGGGVRGGNIAPGAIVLRSRLNSGGVGLKLFGAVWEGDVAITGDNSLRFESGSVFTGTNFTARGAFGVTFAQTCTLAGKSFFLGGISGTPTPFIVGGNNAPAVTLAPDTILRGTNFQLGGESAISSQLVNQGLIRHEGGTSTTGSLGILSNEGVIRAVTNFFSLAPGSLTNNGVIEVGTGATLALAVFTFDQSATGELRGNGQINLNTPIPGGVLRPGENGPGKLTVQSPVGQPASFTGPTTFAMEIGGGTNDQVFFSNGSQSALLSNEIVTLALTLTAAPTAQTYRLLQLPNGAPQLTGTFMGLPDLSTISAPFNGTNYTFIVDYDNKGLSLRDPVATPLGGLPPRLTILRDAANVLLTWPSSATGFELVQNPDLTTTNWSSMSPPADDGTNKSVSLPATLPAQFFRLQKP